MRRTLIREETPDRRKCRSQIDQQGFTLPFDPWMRGALRGFCEERLGSKRVDDRGIFRADQISKLWNGFLSRRPDVTWSRLWILVVLEDWLDRNDVVFDPQTSQTERASL